MEAQKKRHFIHAILFIKTNRKINKEIDKGFQTFEGERTGGNFFRSALNRIQLKITLRKIETNKGGE